MSYLWRDVFPGSWDQEDIRTNERVACPCGEQIWFALKPEEKLVSLPVTCPFCKRHWSLRTYPGGRVEIRPRSD